jgi:uncharacterized DUF497 family protein
MQLTFDPVKNDRNIKDRGITFMLMSEMDWANAYIVEETSQLRRCRCPEMDWANAYIVEDQRNDYGERRFRVLGRINGRLHAAVFTPRVDKIHVISLRKANSREVKIYEKTIES